MTNDLTVAYLKRCQWLLYESTVKLLIEAGSQI